MRNIFKGVWSRWKAIAHKIGEFQSRLILTLFYFVIFAPFALGVKIFSDPLQIKNDGGWLPRSHWGESTFLLARRQY
jgi:hypothetical protein